MSKTDELKKIADEIVTKGVCPELKAGATQLVFGDGNVNAYVVFIGEAPGKNEDIQGLPFVGAAGKFLNEMLESIGLKREDIYITNIVKYRPPNNRDPLPEEKKAFWPYLVRQLNVIKPKLVVTLGRHSMEYFLPEQKISQCHGQPKRIRFVNYNLSGKKALKLQGASSRQGKGEQRTEVYEKYSEGAAQPLTKQTVASDGRVSDSVGEQVITTLTILPLYHPAAALYNGSQREMLMTDFSLIPNILNKI
jgi:DNA polymerase